jgi:hypothetical protein
MVRNRWGSAMIRCTFLGHKWQRITWGGYVFRGSQCVRCHQYGNRRAAER